MDRIVILSIIPPVFFLDPGNIGGFIGTNFCGYNLSRGPKHLFV